MKLQIVTLSLILVGSCATQSNKEKVAAIKKNIVFEDVEVIKKYASTITSEELKGHVYNFTSDKYYGRMTGTDGHDAACEFLRDYYINQEIASPPKESDYFQEIPKSFFKRGINDSQNVVAYIKGSEKPEEVLVISGHSDHEGVVDNRIYYGADDNGSGTCAIMEIAQAFKRATLDGHRPKRSIVFLHATGEEIGLFGSRYYTENPLFPIENTVANLNIDMVGRIDERHKENPNYIYIIGSDKLSTELHFVSEAARNTFSDLELDYKYNTDSDPNRYFYRSDHYNFALKGVPSIFYFNGEHEDYTKPTDTPDKLDYSLLEKRAKLIFSTAWYIANADNKIQVDKEL
ncbi:MAG: M28 family metallopeptidase [Bacteroidota bacterium]